MKLAAGILPYCPKTQRFLLAKRGPMISNPNQWTNFGGKAEKGESPAQTAVREFREESGYRGKVKLLNPFPIKNNKDGFVFVNYIGIVPEEFQPTTIGKKTVDGDIEVSASKWLTKEQLKKLIGSSVLHPGFNQYLLKGSIMNLNEIIDAIDEENVTGSGESYETPFAFGKKVKKPKDVSYSKNIEDEHRFFKKFEQKINEIAYNDFKNDDSRNEKQKINANIIEMNKKLREVEQMINHASRLKLETGQDQSVFWKGTINSFVKIKERLNRLTNKLVEITG